MLDTKSQSDLTAATVEMMRACALATARAASTSMLHGMSFWSRMMQSSAARPGEVFPAWAAAWNQTSAPEANAQTEEALQQASAEPAADPGFSSYRSSGGHAVAQVIVP